MKHVILIFLCMIARTCSSSEYSSSSMHPCSSSEYSTPANLKEVYNFCDNILYRLHIKQNFAALGYNDNHAYQSKIFLGKTEQDKKNRALFMLIMSSVKKKKDDWSLGVIKTPKGKWGIKLYENNPYSFDRKKINKRIKSMFNNLKGSWYSPSMATWAALGFVDKSLTHVLYEKEQAQRVGNVTERAVIAGLAAYFGIGYGDFTCMPQIVENRNDQTAMYLKGSHNRNMLYILINKDVLEQIQERFNFSLSKKHISENMLYYILSQLCD